MSDKFHEINGEKYYCNYCDTKCLRPSEWERHILTRKHKKSCNTDANTDNTDMSTSDCDNSIGRTYKCSCGKQYKHRQSLFTHKKTCTYKPEEKPNLEKYLEYYKWIDSALDYLLQQLKPESTNNINGLKNTIESHILERNKFKHQLPLIINSNKSYDSNISITSNKSTEKSNFLNNLSSSVEEIVNIANIKNYNYKNNYEILNGSGKYRNGKDNKSLFLSRFDFFHQYHL